MLKEEGIETGEPIEAKFNPIYAKAVEEFIMKIEEAHKITRNSKLRFDGYYNGSNYL